MNTATATANTATANTATATANTAETTETTETITLDQFNDLLLLPDWVREQRIEIISRNRISLRNYRPIKIDGFLVKSSTLNGVVICYYESFSLLDRIPETLRFRTGRIPETWSVQGFNVIDNFGQIINQHDLGVTFIPDEFSDLDYDQIDLYLHLDSITTPRTRQ